MLSRSLGLNGLDAGKDQDGDDKQNGTESDTQVLVKRRVDSMALVLNPALAWSRFAAGVLRFGVVHGMQ